jgi:zinc transporter, ZIP family
MIAAVSFDLLPEAQTDIEPWQTGLWMLVVLACGVAAALGFLATDLSGAVRGDRAAALAAGACWRCSRTH